jgi:DNA gyrase subunit A
MILQKHQKEPIKTGKGRIVIRAKVEIQENKKGGYEIVITELPYQVNKARMLMRMADLVSDRKIEGIKTLRDDSDRNGHAGYYRTQKSRSTKSRS